MQKYRRNILETFLEKGRLRCAKLQNNYIEIIVPDLISLHVLVFRFESNAQDLYGETNK